MSRPINPMVFALAVAFAGPALAVDPVIVPPRADRVTIQTARACGGEEVEGIVVTPAMPAFPEYSCAQLEIFLANADLVVRIEGGETKTELELIGVRYEATLPEVRPLDLIPLRVSFPNQVQGETQGFDGKVLGTMPPPWPPDAPVQSAIGWPGDSILIRMDVRGPVLGGVNVEIPFIEVDGLLFRRGVIPLPRLPRPRPRLR